MQVAERWRAKRRPVSMLLSLFGRGCSHDVLHFLSLPSFVTIRLAGVGLINDARKTLTAAPRMVLPDHPNLERLLTQPASRVQELLPHHWQLSNRLLDK